MDAFHPYEYAPVSGDCVCKSVGSVERANEFKGKGFDHREEKLLCVLGATCLIGRLF